MMSDTAGMTWVDVPMRELCAAHMGSYLRIDNGSVKLTGVLVTLVAHPSNPQCPAHDSPLVNILVVHPETGAGTQIVLTGDESVSVSLEKFKR